MNAKRGVFGIQPADAGLFALVIAIVGMMIVPLPTWLLDLLLASNLALAMAMLITALRVPHGLAFSALPAVLLITTLYRLALNVSSTRLILAQADAGRVIRAFGDFVVQGNYAVGAVVFLVITLIQYLVVAKGSERIAEVGARFSLDALPGKQLAIDADLRAGALSPDAARRRRALLERESHFYGAMDGAMKFVKGDAIAGIMIALVCFTGGTGIGVFMHDQSWADSVRTYGLLTIGDALVSQIPSLVISTAAGLVVTRVAEHDRPRSLGQDVAAQLFGAPQVLAGTALFVLALGLVPGLPALPFLLLALGLGAGAFVLQRAAAAAAPQAGGVPARIRLELGWRPGEREHERLERTLRAAAASCSKRLGLTEPTVALVHEPALPPDRYVLVVREAPLARGTARELDAFLAELGELLARHARELLDLSDVQRMLDELATRAPLGPRTIALPALTGLLRQLLDEGVSLRARERILEAVYGAGERPAHEQLELVRRALREQIVHDLGGELAVHRLDPLIEDAVREAIVTRGQARTVALAPALARDIAGRVRLALASNARANLLTQTDIRRSVFELLSGELPEIRVLSYDEIPPSQAIDEREPIRI